MSTVLAGPESTLADVHLAFSRLREGLDTVILGQAQMKAGKLAQGKATLVTAGQEAKLKGLVLLARNAGAAAEIVASKNTDSR